MDSERGDSCPVGLTTQEALNRLHQDITSVVEEYEQSKHKGRFGPWVKDALLRSSRYTILCWSSALALILDGLALLVACIAHSDQRYTYFPLESMIIFVLVGINYFLVVRENRLRHLEIPNRIHGLLKKLKEAENECHWLPENYPQLCSPSSPCITLQWTYRDGCLVNLPWALLVNGDVIAIRPGQQAPGRCVPLEDKDAPVLQAHETYSPSVDTSHDVFCVPTARMPLQNKKYRLEETPYIANLHIALEKALSRPVSYHNQERHLLMIKWIEQHVLIAVLVCVLLVNTLRFFYISMWVESGHWTEMFLVLPVAATLPLLPLMFPMAWLALDWLGMGHIHALIHNTTHIQAPVDPFEETDLAEPQHAAPEIRWKDVWHYSLKVFQGRGEILSRSANFLHVLGSVTALCCVDKKGILSWPNPTAEKVFFLRNSSQKSQSSSFSSVGATHTGAGEDDDEREEKVSKSSFLQHDYNTTQTVAEVLDLTHDLTSPFRLQFDDHTWKQHLNSLKPLGLAILLNTCNMSTQEHYTQFCSHIMCEALQTEDLVPVTNRRCLCELAKQIGFVDHAQDIFTLEEQLSTFRHVQAEVVRRDIKFARSLSIDKLKFPFPHMVGVVVRERSRGGLQLMTQGTADIILDSCVEYWDGHDLCPLSAADRKKVQDFYQRTSLTAYCTAFAYRPLTRGVSSRLSDVYLELPADSKHLYVPHRSPTPLAWDFPRCKGFMGQFHSTDSLLGSDVREEDVGDIEGCFELQCNQVFIGMVTMQYQAQIDMVQLIEQLERACIRFVHFSKENELRSRVFSEKMGLESGWNCHISLLSERNRSDSGHSETWLNSTAGQHLSSPKCCVHRQANCSCPDEHLGLLSPRVGIGSSRPLSFSAPSAINLEMSQVKFEDETHNWIEDSMQNRSSMSHRDEDHVTSQDSVLVHSIDLSPQQEPWHSLSCLTDSTEQSAPVNFDLRNRAKLPRGIEKIRPHLEQIDNVPLLVSLFTDCTPSVTCEMLHIMQEYGEVVCVIGSSANADNMSILMQADASIAVEPLYPQVCQKVPVFKETTPEQGPSPIELSRTLNAIACSLSYRREKSISIFHLIMESRHHMQCVRNCVQFWMCCAVSVSTLQVIGMFLMLPPVFSTGEVLWLFCLVVPLLSLSMVGNPTDPLTMQRATGKNQCDINMQVGVFVLWCYGIKFLVSVAVALVCYVVLLSSFCLQLATSSNSTCTVVYLTTEGAWGGWIHHTDHLLTAQHAVLSLVVLHFVTLSISFVQREYSVWNRGPHHNRTWLIIVFVTLLLQSAYSLPVLMTELHFPSIFLIIGLLSPVLIFFVSEAVKRQEIKVNVRYQKRARLEFDTKLGMNSPF
ncbi:endoplasmic reticulum magnesium-transporting P-type ATPase [Anabrus simplex]|uniref:endoplasmic reticulum magnesium-transporting P-type ATPase n=1 Tax=Anabrus simplex TaxID=316456 RepID=UPI0035A28BD7